MAQRNTQTSGRKKRIHILRPVIQVLAMVAMNGYMIGYKHGKIFTGKSKMFCVPVLNCYSCPGALGACPIGSLQSVISGRHTKVSFYVLGTMMLFGITLGRLTCGFLCPFGLLQDLLYKIPVPRIRIQKTIDKAMRFLKYLVLLFLVFLLPMFLKDKYGIGTTYFCKWLCPAGTLGAGVPLLAANPALRGSIGGLFTWKTIVLCLVVLFATTSYRSFCKYLCPLGAFYSVFNRFSFYQLEVDEEACVHCGKCEKECPMGVEVLKNINGLECIRCGKCRDICETGAIHVKKTIGRAECFDSKSQNEP